MSVEERALGQFPLSVATSLALESACGIHPDHETRNPPLRNHAEFWINMKTLFRNLEGALEKSFAATVMPTPLAEALLQEMEQIRRIVSEYAPRCKVVFYISNYKGMEKKYPHAQLRVDHTPKQKHAAALYVNTIETLNKINQHHGIEIFELKLEPKGTVDAMILTHVPYDLLSYSKFSNLVLVESHTGNIRQRPQWYSKYYNGSELPMMPFREDLIQVFGDKETFRPMPNKLRKDLIDLATKYNWSTVTTRDKILYCLEKLQDPYSREVLKSMLV